MDDLISRQAAIEYFVTNVGFHDEDGYPIEDSDELRKIWTEYFDGIPSAQPERKRGKWIRNNDSDHEWKCSVCGCGYTDYRLNYCYDCGAEMEQ